MYPCEGLNTVPCWIATRMPSSHIAEGCKLNECEELIRRALCVVMVIIRCLQLVQMEPLLQTLIRQRDSEIRWSGIRSLSPLQLPLPRCIASKRTVSGTKEKS